MTIRLHILLIIFGFSLGVYGQKRTTHAYQIMFRFDTLKAYPGVKKIKHTSFRNGQKLKSRSMKLELNEKGGLYPFEPERHPESLNFLIKSPFSNSDSLYVFRKKDSLNRDLLIVYFDPMIVGDSMRYQFKFEGTLRRPSSIEEYRYVKHMDTTFLEESINITYSSNEIVVEYPKSEGITFHYVYNSKGSLIKFFVEDLPIGQHVIFNDFYKFANFDHIPIEFDYTYDEKGRVTAMYETTGGKRELFFTRKFIPR